MEIHLTRKSMLIIKFYANSIVISSSFFLPIHKDSLTINLVL